MYFTKCYAAAGGHGHTQGDDGVMSPSTTSHRLPILVLVELSIKIQSNHTSSIELSATATFVFAHNSLSLRYPPLSNQSIIENISDALICCTARVGDAERNLVLDFLDDFVDREHERAVEERKHGVRLVMI